LVLVLASALTGVGGLAQEGLATQPYPDGSSQPGLNAANHQLPSPAPTPPIPPPTVPKPEAVKPEPSDPNKPLEEDEAELAYRQARQNDKGPFLLASDLFDGVSRMHQSSLVNVTDEYQLGPGDEMLLYVFGSATFEVPLVVDRGGSVTIPRIGAAHVAGLRLGDARRVVQRLVNTLFSNSRVDLQFSKTRDVRIFILGEVYRPGSYVVPSLTSLLNALAAAHGPTRFGSYRKVQLIRGGGVIRTLDLYALRLRGLGMESQLLRDGDTLFVPTAGVQVLFDGAFVRVLASPVFKENPGVLVELMPHESAWDALQLIGGLLPSAYHGLITLQRSDSNGVTSVENLPVDEAFLRGKPLYSNDRLLGLTQAEWQGGVVRVSGQVRVPGSFAQHPGMRLADLLREPDQILPDTYLERGQIIRTHENGATEMLSFNVAQALKGDPAQNLALEPRDRVELFKVDVLRPRATVSILGPFTTPGTFDWHEGMRAADLIFLAGAPRLNADRYYAELAHLDPKGQPGSEVIKLHLPRLLYSVDNPAPALQDPAVNMLLRPFDQITLYEIPDFKVHHTVTINGQVRRPGPYVFMDKHFTLSQLIERAGGLTAAAMAKGGIFLRPGAGVPEVDVSGKVRDTALQDINEILKRLSETKRTKETGNLLPSPVLHGLASGQTHRLVVDFQAALHGDPQRDVELQDGDEIIIPRQADSAYVVGEVASPFATFRVQGKDSVRDLIKLAGGFTRNADKSQVRLLKANGRILDQRILGLPVEPGDAVLVPQRFRINTGWQDNLLLLTPLAILLDAIRR